MSVQAWFSNDELSIDPGASITLQLTVHNLGESTDSYTILPAGLTASWVAVSTPNLTLFGGSQEVVEITISPPALPTTAAGPSVVAIRVLPTSDVDETVVAELTVAIESFADTRLIALQPVVRGRRRASFEFMVENHGNTLASCRLHLVDPTRRVDGAFDPPAVGVAPGGSSLVRLRAKARGGRLRRTTRTLDFDVEAEQQDAAPASAAMALVQPPTVSGTTVGRIAAVLVLIGAVVAAWFGVVRPEIRDAAQGQVDERIAELTPTDTEVPTTTTPSDEQATGDVDTTDDVGATTTTGVPTFIRLAVAPPLTETDDQSTSVEAEFDMTDVRVENPFNDGGQATLLVNGEPRFVWSLDNVRGQLFEPRITPIRLEAGDNITFSVRCDEIGDPSQSTCTNAVNIGGLTIEP
ncbi:MAG: hypothetical protein HRT86_17495 [Ilumatobacteraceae bacterium]|nr:hypothetical protein [Ilumatobacteraceae bacterium]